MKKGTSGPKLEDFLMQPQRQLSLAEKAANAPRASFERKDFPSAALWASKLLDLELQDLEDRLTEQSLFAAMNRKFENTHIADVLRIGLIAKKIRPLVLDAIRGKNTIEAVNALQPTDGLFERLYKNISPEDREEHSLWIEKTLLFMKQVPAELLAWARYKRVFSLAPELVETFSKIPIVQDSTVEPRMPLPSFVIALPSPLILKSPEDSMSLMRVECIRVTLITEANGEACIHCTCLGGSPSDSALHEYLSPPMRKLYLDAHKSEKLRIRAYEAFRTAKANQHAATLEAISFDIHTSKQGLPQDGSLEAPIVRLVLNFLAHINHADLDTPLSATQNSPTTGTPSTIAGGNPFASDNVFDVLNTNSQSADSGSLDAGGGSRPGHHWRKGYYHPYRRKDGSIILHWRNEREINEDLKRTGEPLAGSDTKLK